MLMKIAIDGKLVDRADATVSVFDHGLLYGDGVFEGIRVYNGRVFKGPEHMCRLYESARALYLDIGVAPEQLLEQVLAVVAADAMTNGYVRLVVTRGEGALGIDPATCKKATIIIIADTIQLYPQENYIKGIALITSSYRRIPAECFDVRIKSLNYLNNILAKLEARRAGCLECVMLNSRGHVVECTGDNIFVVKRGALYTPPSHEGALEGITRAVVMEIGMRSGLQVGEKVLTRFDLYNADECFLTGTAAEIIPVTSIDGNVISGGSPGVLTKQMLQEFRAYIEHESHGGS